MTDPTPLLDRLEAAATAGSAKWGGPARNEVLLALVDVARAAAECAEYNGGDAPTDDERDRLIAALSRLAALGQTEEQQ